MFNFFLKKEMISNELYLFLMFSSQQSLGGGSGPSSLVAVTNKVCLSIFFALGVILIAPMFPVGFLKGETFALGQWKSNIEIICFM